MTLQPIVENASASTLPLNTNGQINIHTEGWYGYTVDLNLTSTAAVGNFYIYTQNTNPVGDTFSSSAVATIAVSSGTFPSSNTRYTIDSNFSIVKGWLIISWVGTDSSDGNIAIVGHLSQY